MSKQGINWAIFLDSYGIWRSLDRHEWYEKDPNRVTDAEFHELLNNFDKSLQDFDEILFYHNPGRFHKLYQKLLDNSRLKEKIKRFTHLADIQLI